MQTAAARVDADLSRRYRLQGQQAPTLRGRLLVGIDASEDAERLVRHASRVAERRHLPWSVVHVDVGAERDEQSLAYLQAAQQLAERLGVSDRHLRRLFEAQLGISPLQYLQTRRLLTAKQLLTDTPLPVTEVALASGFGSVRRFNAAFAQHYGLSPMALRRSGAVAGIQLGHCGRKAGLRARAARMRPHPRCPSSSTRM